MCSTNSVTDEKQEIFSEGFYQKVNYLSPFSFIHPHVPSVSWRMLYYSCSREQMLPMGDHLCTCTNHSGVQKQLTSYLANTTGSVPLVMDLRITHDRFGSNFDPSLNGHLHYPNDIDKSLNEVVTDKIRPPHGVLDHPESKSRQYPHQGFSFTYYTQYWWDTYHFKNTFSPITLANISSINLVSIFRCSSSPSKPVYVRRVGFSDLVFSLSSHRHSYIGLVFSSRFLNS
jgi:hypothetical protein